MSAPQSSYAPGFWVLFGARFLFVEGVCIWFSFAIQSATTEAQRHGEQGTNSVADRNADVETSRVARASSGQGPVHAGDWSGVSVVGLRYAEVAIAGLLCGVAGAYLSTALQAGFVKDMSAGRGWIALALVVFSTWAPRRVLLGAYLFGAVWIMGLYAQGVGVAIAPQLLSSLPYLLTIVALVLISGNRFLTKRNTPACINLPFVPDR